MLPLFIYNGYNFFILFIEPEEDAESCLRALKFDNLTSEQFDSTWKACCQFRLQFIKSNNDTAQIMDKWPFYRTPSGYRLVKLFIPLTCSFS